jgi:hypothetical protein
MRSATTKKRLASRKPPSHQPSAVSAAANPPSRSHALATLRAM